MSRPTNNFAMARLSRDLPNRSYIGGIAISREGMADPESYEGDYNRTYGFDGRWGIGEYGLDTGFRCKDRDPRGRSGRARLSAGWWLQLGKLVVERQLHRGGRRLQPRGGVRHPRGYRKVDGAILRRIRPENLGRSTSSGLMSPTAASGTSTVFRRPASCTSTTTPQWKSGATSSTARVNFSREGVTEAFEIYPEVVGAAGYLRPHGISSHVLSPIRGRR